ncbi:MAG: NrdJb [Gammaproteobacteria bacterium]|uniref:ribonucleoside-diphosphate reductase n=1 Tax=Candidatus Thiopontia autotrophica TaxID=2841688 RepID=A0A8J6TSA2_9GAMM|nr:NrdJb [Candidatus Thiopontia autotrophica]MBL6969559.1 NrdJb [Gammaproteobacteria bacterium]
MTVKIETKIVGYQVVDEDLSVGGSAGEAITETVEDKGNVIQMHEKLERPEQLVGSTYKIKTPLSEHALYVTVNDMILNEGTDHEQRRPFEIFINSKNMDHFQWIVALTRIISAVFRKGGDVTFLVEELRSVFDPRGGYFKKGGKYMPSLVAEIGDCIECHLKFIGMIGGDCMEDHQKEFLAKKRAEFENQGKSEPVATAEPDSASTSFPAGAQLCAKCSTKAVIKMDGCMTCLNCGESKCG